jgi:predicted Zn-dependent peptidase
MKRNDSDVYALILLNGILGTGETSLLRKGLWTDHVISPNVTSSLGFGRGCGYLMVSGSVSPNLVDSVMIVFETITENLLQYGVAVSELEVAKEQFLADSPLTFASNRSLQGLLKEAYVYDIPVQEAMNFAGNIRDVTVEDVRRVARRVMVRAKQRIVLLGDEKKFVPELQRLGFDVKVLEN